MIITALSRVPVTWIVIATLPLVALFFKDRMMGIGFTLSIRNFVENPAALTFLLALPGAIGWVIPPIANFLSDCIWTRAGRRKPFIIASWVGTIGAFILMPLMDGFWSLVACYMVFSACNGLGGPVTALKMEIVPPSQRILASVIMSWLVQVAVLMFWVVGIGRFDQVSNIFGGALVGETALYWAVALAMVAMLAVLCLGIRETRPRVLAERSAGVWTPIRASLRSLVSFQLFGVYILAFSTAILGVGLGAMNTLLYVEQFGVSNQEMGINIAIGGLLNLLLIPVLGMLSTRMGKMRVYIGLIIAGILVNGSMYLYYHHCLDNGRPTLIEMVVFGEMLSVIGVLKAMSLTPLVYDYVRRDELGTYAAGQGVIEHWTNLLTATLVGLFVFWYATTWLAPAGVRVRVAVAEDTPQPAIAATLAAFPFAAPEGTKDLRLHAEAYFGNNTRQTHGTAYDIRLADDRATAIRESIERIEGERRTADVALRFHRASQGPATPAITGPWRPVDPTNPVAETDAVLAEAARRRAAGPGIVGGQTAAIAVLVAAKADFQAELDRRSAALRSQVLEALGDQVLSTGGQVLGAATAPVLRASWPLTGPPIDRTAEQLLDALRRADPAILDLVVRDVGGVYRLEASRRQDDGADAAAVTASLDQALAELPTAAMALGLRWPASPNTSAGTAITLDLRVLEDPIDRHPSPITRVVHAIQTAVGFPPDPPDRVHAALARSLRRPGWVDHAAVGPVPGQERAVRITALADAMPADALATWGALDVAAADVPTDRLGSLLGDRAGPAGDLYRLAVTAAKGQRLTVPMPVMAADVAKQQYDYLAGFLAILCLQVIGLGVALVFAAMVASGRLRPRGLEEAQAQEQAS
jgi:nitrate/nitrite transporter NarK